jgi:hypothetical protein
VGGLIGLGAAGQEGFEVGAERGAEAVAERGGVLDEEEAWDVLAEIPPDTAGLLILGASTSRTGLVASRCSLRAASTMRPRIERHAMTPLWLSLASRSCCQRSTTEGVI